MNNESNDEDYDQFYDVSYDYKMINTTFKSYFELCMTGKYNNKNIPDEIVEKYLRPNIIGFISPVQVCCKTWKDVVEILTRLNQDLPYDLSEEEAIEIFDGTNQFICNTHQKHICKNCKKLFYKVSHYLTLEEFDKLKSKTYNDKLFIALLDKLIEKDDVIEFNDVFTLTEAYQKMLNFYSALHPNNSTYYFFHIEIGRIQISYINSYFVDKRKERCL